MLSVWTPNRAATPVCYARRSLRRLLPLTGIVLFLAVWQAAVTASPSTLVPTPWQAFLAIVELARKGLLVRYMVASLDTQFLGTSTGIRRRATRSSRSGCAPRAR